MVKTNTAPARVQAPVKGVQKPVVEKEKKGRPAHPLVGVAGQHPFVGLPADFNFKTMRPLKKSDFTEEAAYWEYKASQFAWQAEICTSTATECRALGSKEDRSRVRKLAKLQEKIEATRSELLASGLTPEQLEGLIQNLMAAKTSA